MNNKRMTRLKHERGGVPVTSWMNSIKVFLLTAVLLVLAAYGECHAAATGNLKIAMLAVGSADATVIVFPTGKIMLVDCGLEVNCKNDVIPFLKRQKITHLDYFMITHPHADHDGSGKGKSLLTSAGLINTTTTMFDYKKIEIEIETETGLQKRKIGIGEEFDLEGTHVFLLNAWTEARKKANPNTNCIAFRMEYNGYVYQHGGDLDDPSIQDEIAKNNPNKVRCNFFHTFHHMWGGISLDYFKKADYQLALVSCGKDISKKGTSTAWPIFMDGCNYLTPSAGHGGRFIKYYVTGARGSVADGNVVMRINSETQWTKENHPNLDETVTDFPGVTIATAYTITAGTNAGGTISPIGVVSVSQGASKTFTITPSAGYVISALKVDNATLAAAPTYTFNNVQAAHTINATFAPAPVTTYKLTVNSGSGSGNFTTGKIVSITANAAPAGQVFNAWTGNAAYVASINSPSTTVTMPSVAVTLTATYKVLPPPPPPATPIASIVATDSSAGESGANSGTFTVTLSPAPTAAKVVSYAITGSATSADYHEVLSGTVTVPTTGTATITVTPKADSQNNEGNETVILTLAASSGYTVGTSKVATVTIADAGVPPPPRSFVRRINMNGAATTIEGHEWIAYSTALTQGLSVTSTARVNLFTASVPITPSPVVDANTNAMLNTAIWSVGSFTVNQTVPNGTYSVTIWLMENYATNHRSFDVKLEGTLKTASPIGALTLGTWQKYTYSSPVTDGVLNIDFAKVTGESGLMGLEITLNPSASASIAQPSELIATWMTASR